MSEVVLEVKNLCKDYVSGKTAVKAASNISFNLNKGETFGLVGESGCGKTTVGRCIARGIEATSGQVLYHKGDKTYDFIHTDKATMKHIRKDIQMIFQDPYSSLDPRMTVFDIIKEPLVANFKLSKEEAEQKVKEIAEKAGLNVSYLKRYPHAFSGGQRQRIGIARALVTYPEVIVCDEAVSALDVSIQSQIINLLSDLQAELGLTYIFISHDLSVVEYISDRVGVMYLGRLVEMADCSEIFHNPKHPYTHALLSAVPKPDPTNRMNRVILQGEVPNPANPPTGCHFHPRCPYKKDICSQVAPEFVDIGGGHCVACHFAQELHLSGVHDSDKAE